MNAPSLFEGFEPEPEVVAPKPVRPQPEALRASTHEKADEPGITGALVAFALDLDDACHFARAGLRPLRYDWWRERLASQMGDLSAERGWDRWRADLVRYRVPHRLVGPDGLDVERGGEVAIALDVPAAERRASRMLVAAAIRRALEHFPMETVTTMEEDGGVIFGGVTRDEAVASARKLRRSAAIAAGKRAQAAEAVRRAAFRAWRKGMGDA